MFIDIITHRTVPCLLLELLDAFLKAVPVVGLACTPDAAAVDTLEAYLQAQTETAY